MANPRRGSFQFQSSSSPILPVSSDQHIPPAAPPPPFARRLSLSASSAAALLKRPQAIPVVLSLFVLLTWLSLRLQVQHRPPPSATAASSSSSILRGVAADGDANLVRFGAEKLRDRRGWLVSPLASALQAGIVGGPQQCAAVHVGEIRPGAMRGNHRHHSCNESFVIWGATTKFRLENKRIGDKGYAEAIIDGDEVAVASSPSGTAHALINMDRSRSTFFLGCQDRLVDYNASTTDYNVWGDL